ncbi:HNH endonuclease signature motif containing protein [Mycobacterium sp. 1274756.6]|uniref:HNH endonuclease signature motif containing protein n=1 Tax=Mycobacterium sp. 1274756.6 TaxID=1834076 RepID=UPI0007FE9B42|nr:HNH endonuclease signature motif containing protein [Mycobacterium sp. 1274756.6]OBJ68735.1 hypothetical protein A5643_13595 [Mycobacterium sp. 1274756.6]
MFEYCWTETPATTALLDRITAAARAENRAAGERLVAIGRLDTLRAREHAAEEKWSIDTYEAVSAEVAAALGIGHRLAGSYLEYARDLRDRLPKVGALLLAGDISDSTFRTISYRTGLVNDAEALATVDAAVAARAARWPALSQSRLAGHIDRIIARVDRDAVRKRREVLAGREVTTFDLLGGLTEVRGRLITADARAVDARLDALADTVCEEDPRTRQQRRADALGALAAGAERLTCLCRRADCAAANKPAPRPVVIHVVADQQALNGEQDSSASLLNADGLIPPELLVELAASARLRPLIHPVDAPPEKGYTPSRALAEFIRCRDLTCRFPDCDEPALCCDIDHTVPFGAGGRTHASNCKLLCRKHHLLKTFLRWRDKQLPDGTVIWTAPSGHTYVTLPGSTLLFPSLCAPTGDLEPPDPERARQCTNRTALMPTRRRTRAAAHARYVTAERRRNRNARLARQAEMIAADSSPPADDDPPPF